MILFKNLKANRLEEFWSDGAVALHPLRHFATIEDEERRDELEGSRGITFSEDHPRPETMKFTPDEFWTAENNVVRGGPILIEPLANVNIVEVMPEAYVFCVSETTVARYGDVAYRIDEPERFKEILVEAMKRRGIPILDAWLGKVTYGGPKDPIVDFANAKESFSRLRTELIRIDHYFLKPSRLAKDREWRFVLFPENGEANESPLIIKDKESMQPSLVDWLKVQEQEASVDEPRAILVGGNTLKRSA
jgi:hypothetical protein